MDQLETHPINSEVLHAIGTATKMSKSWIMNTSVLFTHYKAQLRKSFISFVRITGKPSLLSVDQLETHPINSEVLQLARQLKCVKVGL